ncbi:Uncharacterised protein [Shigella sonnei]|nr:Uncharacterised protein [Shigella sonnei]CST33301.1 Uncharacterised protein [Shigella sonnei]
MQRFCGDSEISIAFRDGISNLCRRALVHMQRNAGITLNKAFDNVW